MSTSILTLAGVFLFIFSSFANHLQDSGLPLNINVCKRSEADYSSCLTKAIQDAWPIFVKGIPEIESPLLEPLTFDRVQRTLESGQLTGSAVLTNINFYGLAKTKFVSARAQFAGNRVRLELNVKIPRVVIECDYKAQGAVNSVNVAGKGHFNVSMDGLSAKWTLDGIVKNDRLVVKHFRINPEVQGMEVYFSDLFNGNQMLNDGAIFLVNQSWPLFFNRMKPIIIELTDAYLASFVNRIVFSKVAASKLFPL